MTDPYVIGGTIESELEKLIAWRRKAEIRLDEMERHFAAVSQVVDFLETQTPPRNPVGG